MCNLLKADIARADINHSVGTVFMGYSLRTSINIHDRLTATAMLLEYTDVKVIQT